MDGHSEYDEYEQKVKNLLSLMASNVLEDTQKLLSEAIGHARYACEKQIARQAPFDTVKNKFVCPACKEPVITQPGGIRFYNYCPNCGQALKRMRMSE